MSQFSTGRDKGGFKTAVALPLWSRVRVDPSTNLLVLAGAADTDWVGVVSVPPTRLLADSTSHLPVTVTLRSAEGTRQMIAAGPFDRGTVYAAADGKIAGSGTVAVGVALEPANANGDYIEVLENASNDLGACARAGITQEQDVPYTVPLSDMLATGTGARLGTAAGTPAGALGLTVGTFGAASPKLVGEAASGNAKSDKCRFAFVLPAEYDPGQALTLRVKARVTGLLELSETIDASVYKTDGAAGVSADLCATNAQTLTAAFVNYDFTITPTGLVPGDLLDVQLTAAVDDTGGTANKLAEIGAVQLLLRIRG